MAHQNNEAPQFQRSVVARSHGWHSTKSDLDPDSPPPSSLRKRRMLVVICRTVKAQTPGSATARSSPSKLTISTPGDFSGSSPKTYKARNGQTCRPPQQGMRRAVRGSDQSDLRYIIRRQLLLAARTGTGSQTHPMSVLRRRSNF